MTKKIRHRKSDRTKGMSRAILGWLQDDFKNLSEMDILELTLDIAPNNLEEEKRLWKIAGEVRPFETRENFLKRNMGFKN